MSVAKFGLPDPQGEETEPEIASDRATAKEHARNIESAFRKALQLAEDQALEECHRAIEHGDFVTARRWNDRARMLRPLVHALWEDADGIVNSSETSSLDARRDQPSEGMTTDDPSANLATPPKADAPAAVDLAEEKITVPQVQKRHTPRPWWQALSWERLRVAASHYSPFVLFAVAVAYYGSSLLLTPGQATDESASWLIVIAAMTAIALGVAAFQYARDRRAATARVRESHELTQADAAFLKEIEDSMNKILRG